MFLLIVRDLIEKYKYFLSSLLKMLEKTVYFSEVFFFFFWTRLTFYIWRRNIDAVILQREDSLCSQSFAGQRSLEICREAVAT